MNRLTRKLIRVLIVFILFVFLVSFVYHNLEHWTWLDSVYFTIITSTTIGYGDITPTTQAGKMFTIFVSLIGIAIAFYTISVIVRYFLSIELRREKEKRKEKRGVVRLRRRKKV